MSLPSTIGRFHVVGHLAAGGMAEILLAKQFGPAGFEQAVVLKRILPHLLQQEQFASMFLDEARIVARLNHPNVVRIQELGREEGELFLAMEYLEGENLHGLMRRLASHDLRLDWASCAYIAAEACAGLHAAHELRDPDGEPLHLVHRDVSPQNVFVTYGGEVKLLDFGIAKAADRITRTQVGEVKGKWAYMSPEQVEGRGLDRRSDLFSLGIVLYELSTERRLFQRASEMLTMKAVTERPIRAPSELIANYPRALEDLVMRALSRDREQRFQTAAEMRRDLLSCMRALGADLAPEEALARRMTELFPDRIAEKREMLRRLRSGSHVTHVPTAEVDLDVQIPSAVHEPSDATRIAVPADHPLRRRRRRNRWLAAALLVGLVGLAAALVPGSTWPWGAGGAPSGPTGAVAADGRGEALPEGEAGSAAAAESEERVASAARTAAEGAPQGTVTLRIETAPVGTPVWVDGERAGRGPVEVQVPRGEGVVVVARRAGWVAASERLVPVGDRTVRLRLRRRSQGGSATDIEEEAAIERFR